VKASGTTKLEAALRSAEEDRDYFKQQYDRLVGQSGNQTE